MDHSLTSTMDKTGNDLSIVPTKNNGVNSVNCQHICHFCLHYRCSSRCDMKKHVNKKKKCSLTYTPIKMFTFQEAAKISLTNKYYFLFDTSILHHIDYIYIVNTFAHPVNYITYEDILKSKPHLQPYQLTDTSSGVQDKINQPTNHLSFTPFKTDGSFDPSRSTLIFPYTKPIINSNECLPSDMSLLPSRQIEDLQKVEGTCPKAASYQHTVDNTLSGSTLGFANQITHLDPSQRSESSPSLPLLIDQRPQEPGWENCDDSLLTTRLGQRPKVRNDRRSPAICSDMSRDMSTIGGGQSSPSVVDSKMISTVVNDQLSKENKKSFDCPRCGKSYKYKKDLYQHSMNPSLCEKIRSLNALYKKNDGKDLNSIIEDGKEIRKGVINSIIQNNTAINTQNIFNSSLKLDIKDFGKDLYDYSHINTSFIKQPDFFLYDIFLNKLLENKINRNIFFITGNEETVSEKRRAVIYADNIFYQISEDNAIYMVLVKLQKIMEYMLPKFFKAGTEKEKTQVAEILRYYRVVTGHFKHDTVYKEYRIDDNDFYNLQHRRRSRDVYTAKVKMLYYNYGTPISELITSAKVHTLEMFKPDVEDYASTRLRNKDLRPRKEDARF